MSDRPTRSGGWLREPLLHFFVLGVGLFALYRLVGGAADAPEAIVVSEARVEALAQSFARTWMRPPTAQELAGLVEDFLKEEIYYREALQLGLDRDDTVIRRRLRQKLEFVSEDIASAAEPTDAELQAYLDAHPEPFAEPPRVTFEQVFLSGERHGAATRGDAEKLLAELQAGRGPASPAAAGDPTLLPPGLEQASPQEVAKTFGEAFARGLDPVPVGSWAGPVESSFGLHLVRVSARTAAATPTLEAVRGVVLRDWQAEQRERANDAFYEELREKYDVRVDGELGRALGLGPEPGPAGAGG